MNQRTGHLAIDDGSRYMQRLCFHFSKKVRASFNETEGTVEFPWGRCHMRSDATGIRFECRAEDEEAVQRVQHVIDEHVKLFARKAPLVVQWSPAD